MARLVFEPLQPTVRPVKPVVWIAATLLAQTFGGALAATAPATRPDLSDADRARVATITRPANDFSRAEPFERMQGGAGTVKKLINADIFSQPAANLSFEGRQEFSVGNGLFRKNWVSSPASTLASDGLGPLFNARSCQACHVKDGRGTVPGFDPDPLARSDAVGLLLRLSVLPEKNGGEHTPDPVYGGQFQPFAVPGLLAEGDVEIRYSEVPVALNGGETVDPGSASRAACPMIRSLCWGVA